jgi:serine O-acetyltransferase
MTTGSKSPDPVPAISATEPDWSRERCTRLWDPGRRMLQVLRAYQKVRGNGTWFRRLAAMTLVPVYRFWAAMCGADIPLDARIGGGLAMPHANGIVIHPAAVVGPNCLIFQQVTLGTGGPLPGAPRIDGHADIGAGAKVLGGVHVGEHTKIGANAVVLCDVPAGATAVGVPARIIMPGGGGARPAAERQDRSVHIGA